MNYLDLIHFFIGFIFGWILMKGYLEKKKDAPVQQSVLSDTQMVIYPKLGLAYRYRGGQLAIIDLREMKILGVV